MEDWTAKPDTYWQEKLTPEEYQVLRKKGTERAFSNKYWDEKTPGVYTCKGCGLELFGSDTKFDSGTGWPSFWAPLRPEAVETETDYSHFMSRTEVHCPRC